MGMFFSSLWNRLFAFKEFKICIVGLDNAGKTTILYQLHMGEVVDTQPTIGSNVESIVHKNVKFSAWDLAGQETLRHSWATYYQGTNAIILVVDSTDAKRLPLSKTELFKLLSDEQLRSAVLLVLANKSDCPHKLTPAQIADQLSLASIKSHAWHIQACSALTGDGLYAGMEWICQSVTGSSAAANGINNPKSAPPAATTAGTAASNSAAAAAAPAPAAAAAVDVKTPSKK